MQQQFVHIERQKSAFFVFAGMGGGALGAQKAPPAFYRGLMATCAVLGGIDVDPLACQDFEMWTGVPATCLDLFDADQYRDWHGHEPPDNWSEVSLEQIRAAAQNRRPNIVVITAPCKGYSGLLSKSKAQSKQYQALNRLAERGVFLTLEAWKDDLPEFLLFENVKGITTRGGRFLRNIQRLLDHYGYRWHPEHYDCGELGGLAQHRKRFLGAARNAAKVPCYLYNPPKRRVRAIGEVLEQMPLPIDPDNPPADLDAAGGPMHKLPRLTWKTWVRLALIPPGGDWRDLNRIQPGEYSIVPVPGMPKCYDIVRTADLVGPGIPPGAPIVDDYRQAHMSEGETFPHKYAVQDMQDPGATVTGSRMGSGMGAVADPRPLGHTPMGNGRGAYLVQDMSDPSATITGDPSHRKSGGASVIADHRLASTQRDGAMRVGGWTEPSGPVIGSAAVTSSNGIGAVADPRPHRPGRESFSNMLRMGDWEEPAPAVTGAAGPSQSAALVADPRPTCASRNGTMGVTDWSDTSPAVVGAADLHNSGCSTVADPRPMPLAESPVWDCRIPADNERGVWFIRSPHRDKKGRRCVHRPMTTLELLAIQSFPWRHKDGRPVVLAGKSDRAWRDRIGNAFPPDAAEAIIHEMLISLLAAETDDFLFDLKQTGIWVQPDVTEEAPVLQ